MKSMKPIGCTAMAAVMVLSAGCAKSSTTSKHESAAATEDGAGAVRAVSYTEKQIKGILLNTETPQTFTCLVRDDLPEVPYISVEDYLNQLFTVPVSAKSDGKGVYTFGNGSYSLTADADKDTFAADCIELFLMTNHKPYTEGEIADYTKESGESPFVGEVKGFTLDFSRYDIDMVDRQGKVYLPCYTLGDLFADTGCTVRYKDDALHFVSAYEMRSFGGGMEKLGDTRSKALAEYSYRELCMTMDAVSGLPSKAILSESIRKNGFDKALTSYNGMTAGVKELLLSESTADYCKGMRLLDYYLDDGGHTTMTQGLEKAMEKYSIPNAAGVADQLFAETEPDEAAAIRAAITERASANEQRSAIAAEKKAAYSQLECVRTENGTSLYRAGDTCIFEFTEFKNEVIAPFKSALDYAAAQNAKNFVIDVSTNYGGSDEVVTYMLHAMCGEDRHLAFSRTSGNIVKRNELVDLNLDGKFDAADSEVHYDFRFAVITSQYSYSNANCMPCAAQDQGVAILGEASGGGCCIVSSRFYPNGCLYSLSGSTGNIHPDGTDVDTGTVPDTKLPGKEANYKGFFDINAINAGIEAFYQK